MEELRNLIGIETEMPRVAAGLRGSAEALQVAAVGAYQVTCSDETEWECAEAFQQSFGQSLLPPLKSSRRAVFRTMNLGARYEPGALRVAVEHFALPSPPGTSRLLVAKINAHVAQRRTPNGLEYGHLDRYGSLSSCCGALAALLDERPLPVVEELRQTFQGSGRDRLGVLRDPEKTAPQLRALLAAIVSAQLQAQRAVGDLQHFRPKTPTRVVLLPCVSVNRPGPDTELVVGCHQVDWTGETWAATYEGLDNDPAAYRVGYRQGRLYVEDGRWGS